MEAASRASGWYKVQMFDEPRSELAAYDAESGEWFVNGDNERFQDKHFSFIGKNMVMAPNGALMPANENVMPTGRAHELKILPQYFNSVIRGDKRAELRKNDRDYQVGDVLILREWTEAHGYSGMVTAHIISDVCDVGFIAEGYVMLSMFKPVEHINAVLVNAPQFVTITGSL